jgi:hypothetical protein
MCLNISKVGMKSEVGRKKSALEPSMVANTYNHSTWEVEAG